MQKESANTIARTPAEKRISVFGLVKFLFLNKDPDLLGDVAENLTDMFGIDECRLMLSILKQTEQLRGRSKSWQKKLFVLCSQLTATGMSKSPQPDSGTAQEYARPPA